MKRFVYQNLAVVGSGMFAGVMLTIGLSLGRFLAAHGFDKVSTRPAPDSIVRVVGLFDRNVRGLVAFLGQPVGSDRTATVRDLVWTPIPFEKTVLYMAALPGRRPSMRDRCAARRRPRRYDSRKASRSWLSRSLCVSVMPWGAPG